MSVEEQIRKYGPIRYFDGRDIPADVERQLWAFRRKLLRLRISQSICTVGDNRFELFVAKIGFTILAINGQRNPFLQPSAA